MILLLGATGFTGEMIAIELARSTDLILMGRNERRIRQLSGKIEKCTGQKVKFFQISSIDEISKFDLKGFGVKAILNLLGPYSKFGEKVVLYALNNGLNYLDITAEAEFIINVWKKYNYKVLEKKFLFIQAVRLISAVGEFIINTFLKNVEEKPKKVFLLYNFPFIVSTKNLRSLFYLISSPPVHTKLESIWWMGWNG